MRHTTWILVVVVVVGCQGGTGSRRVKKLLGGDDGYALVTAPEQVEAYRIDGTARAGTGNSTGRIQGYPVLSGPVPVDDAWIRTLETVLTEDDTYIWESAKACEFVPGVVIRYTARNDRMDVLLCFSCDELAIYLNNQRVGSEDFDPRRCDLVRVARELFPKDKAIQALR